MLATIYGAVYLQNGLLAIAVTGGVGIIATKGGLLLGLFEVNPLHNVAHLLIGAALVIAGLSSIRASRTVNSVIGAVYLLLGIVGLFILDSPANILAINGWDNVLHFASAIILLGVGLGADKGRVATA
jgi:hypothetical protein